MRQAIKTDVMSGYAPVLDAVVTAIIQGPHGTSEIRLKDNGLGADTIPNDGIYAAYFLNFTGNGRYRVKVKVMSDNDRTKVMTGGMSGVNDLLYQYDGRSK